MMRSYILWVIVFLAGALGLYMVKYKVQAIRTEVAVTEKQLREEKKNLHVLSAEWTYLNRPDRLRQLSAKYLDVKPAHAQQIADFASFPYDKTNEAKPGSQQVDADSEDALPDEEGVTLASGTAHVR